MTDYTYCSSTFADLHKEAYGFRPHQNHQFYHTIPSIKQHIWDEALATLAANEERAAVTRVECIESFNQAVADHIDGAEGVIRDILHKHRIYDIHEVEWVLGLPHGYLANDYEVVEVAA